MINHMIFVFTGLAILGTIDTIVNLKKKNKRKQQESLAMTIASSITVGVLVFVKYYVM